MQPPKVDEHANAAPWQETSEGSKRVLEPNERVAEVLFGLIMVLTFTGSLSVSNADRSEVRTMLIGAIGCNVAWGFIDGIMYLLSSLAEKGRSQTVLRMVRESPTSQVAQQHIEDALPSIIASVLQPSELDAIHQRLKALPESANRERLHKEDWLGAISVFLLVFASTFPVVIPFIFMRDAAVALRVSNGIAIVMMFVAGYVYGKCVHRQPLLIGVAMVLLGSVLVALTIALGG